MDYTPRVYLTNLLEMEAALALSVSLHVSYKV